MTKPDKKLAILIDAENISSKYVKIILEEAVNTGNVIYKRIYGDWTSQSLNSWKNVLLDNAISPIQQFSNTNGKNASDSALIIDAMDLLYQASIDSFCIVSSDSDFTKLASRLRESDKYVLGMGEQKTPRSFISACNKFLYLDLLLNGENGERPFGNPFAKTTRSTANAPAAQDAAGEPTKSEVPAVDAPPAKEGSTTSPASGKRGKGTAVKSRGDDAKSKKDAPPVEAPAASSAEIAVEPPAEVSIKAQAIASGKDIDTVKNTLLKLAEEKSDDEGWIFSGLLGSLLNKQLPDFDVRNFGYRKLVDFISSLQIFKMNVIQDNINPTTKHIYFKIKE